MGSVARAQRVTTIPPLCTHNAAQAYFDFQVSRPAALLRTPRGATRPGVVRDTSSVVVQFIVDTLGRVEIPSLQVLRARDSALVRRALRDAHTWTYRPAVWNACAHVRQLVRAAARP